jgi:hypothetical protein
MDLGVKRPMNSMSRPARTLKKPEQLLGHKARIHKVGSQSKDNQGDTHGQTVRRDRPEQSAS